ncbi:hypothetical protein IWX46DRAFT_580178 [Phyllosticta citricarpa]|uniref:Uncharacterized protein n=1 Tax=Phyllosticta citricarpa TaxID=55181 RepID=A0ABR1MFT0_9PEZI
MCYNTIRHACGTRIRRQSLSCSCGTNGGDRECSLRCGTCQQCGHGSAAIAPMTRITTTNTNAAANATETSKPDPDDAAASDAAGSASTTATTSPTASSPTAAPGMPKLFPVPGVAAAAAAAELAVASSGPAKLALSNPFRFESPDLFFEQAQSRMSICHLCVRFFIPFLESTFVRSSSFIPHSPQPTRPNLSRQIEHEHQRSHASTILFLFAASRSATQPGSCRRPCEKGGLEIPDGRTARQAERPERRNQIAPASDEMKDSGQTRTDRQTPQDARVSRSTHPHHPSTTDPDAHLATTTTAAVPPSTKAATPRHAAAISNRKQPPPPPPAVADGMDGARLPSVCSCELAWFGAELWDDWDFERMLNTSLLWKIPGRGDGDEEEESTETDSGLKMKMLKEWRS